MYPSPASAYRPQFNAQISNPNSQPTPPPQPQFTPQLSNPNVQPPPPSASTLTYPRPQYPSQPNIPAVSYPGHPGQPPPFPQTTPYAASTTNPQINNINGFLPVSTIIDQSICLFISCRIIQVSVLI